MSLQFGAPSFLWLLLLVPALWAFFWWARRSKQRLMTRFIQARLLPGLLVEVSAARRRIRLALWLSAAALLAVTLARPKWGFHLEEVRQRGLDIVVAIDTSRSMVANDVAPNRLERSKLEAIALQQLCRADRLGLVAFAGTAFLQCPLSLDDDAFRQGLEALNVNIIPQGGTALAEAIRTALTAFKEKTDNHKVLVLFSDGEDHDGQAVEAAQQAAQQSMRIFTIGVGSANGELLSVTDEQGRRSFLKDDQGNVVKSRLNEALLQQVAAAGQGFYLPLSGAKTMDTLYQRGLAPLPKTDSDARTIRQYHERFQWFLGLAIVLLLFEMLLPETKRNPKPGGPGPGGEGRGRAWAAGVILLLLLPGVMPAPAASAARALRQYEKGRYDEALREYEKLARNRPADARLRFNAGAAAYQDKEYDQALQQFSASLSSPDLALQEKAYYNLGNTHYRLGEEASDPKKQKAEWQQAVSHYESALKLDARDEDARHNLAFVKKRLEELQQQQQQEQNKDQNDQDKNQDKKDQQEKKDQDKDQQDKSQQQDKSEQQNQQQDQQQNKESGQKGEEQKSQNQSPPQEEKPSQAPQPDPSQQQDSPSSPSQDDKKEDAAQQQEALPQGKVMQMTPQQARQLLDAQRAEEKPMPFWRLLRTNRVDRFFKDW
jgi:Ca-activated chloride channel homolog